MSINRRRFIAAAAAMGLAATSPLVRAAPVRSGTSSISGPAFNGFLEYPDALPGPSVRVGVGWSQDREFQCRSAREAVDAFNGEVAFDLADWDPSARPSDAVFANVDVWQCGTPSTAVRVGFPDDRTGRVTRWLTVHAASLFYPAMPRVLTTVLAPSFAPGIVGVDWDDVRALLGRGSTGLLALAGADDPDKAWPFLLKDLDDALVALGSPSVIAALAVLSHRSPTLAQVRMAGVVAKSLVGSDGPALFAAPLLAEGDAVCALLVVTDRPTGHALDR